MALQQLSLVHLLSPVALAIAEHCGAIQGVSNVAMTRKTDPTLYVSFKALHFSLPHDLSGPDHDFSRV